MCSLPRKPANKAIAYSWMQYCDCPRPEPQTPTLRRVGGVLTVVDPEQADWVGEWGQLLDEEWAQWKRLSEKRRLGGI